MRLLLCMIACLFPVAAMAADLEVEVSTPGGKPVSDAVVSVYPAAGAGPIRLGRPYRMTQQNMKFDPFVLVVPVGATVAFPNKDATRHHVYSFSPAKTFELKLYGRDESRSVVFDKAGVVAVGCNIHDSMVAFIKVVDTRYAAKTEADGRVVVKDLPAGKAIVRVWHPYMKGAGAETTFTVVLGQGVTRERVSAEVRARAPRPHGY